MQEQRPITNDRHDRPIGLLGDDDRPAVIGGHGRSLRSGRSSECSCIRHDRSSIARWRDTLRGSISSSRTSRSSTSPPMLSWTSSRTGLLKRRRRSSNSTASSRSSASSSSSVRSALRVTRNTAHSSTTMPTNNVGRCAAMIFSTGRKRPSSSATRRGNTLGTLSRTNRRSPVSGSATLAAMLRARLEMYGNGWPGSTASGVSTGKIRSS